MKKLSVFILSAMAALTMTACCGNTPKECDKCDKIPVALQLYSVRDNVAQDFYGTLKAVKEMGYDGVEFAGLFDHSPEQVKAWCKELGLNPISAHVPLVDMLADIDKVIADYKAIGCEYIVVPYVTAELHPDGEQFSQMIQDIAAIGEKVKAADMVLLYHNHDFEFKLTPDGKIGLDALYEAVPAELLQTELDLCWVKYAGQCPVEYVKKYAGRSPVVHFKDYYTAGEQTEDPYALIGLNEGEKKENKTFEFRPLGYGVQDVHALLKAAKEAGSKWIVVEQDQPSMEKSAMECVKMSIDYLNSLCCKEACHSKCDAEKCATCDKKENCDHKNAACDAEKCSKCDKQDACDHKQVKCDAEKCSKCEKQDACDHKATCEKECDKAEHKCDEAHKVQCDGKCQGCK